jgi:hypothetical protein
VEWGIKRTALLVGWMMKGVALLGDHRMKEIIEVKAV